MFPIRHSFSYSYLLAGIPVGFKGSIGGIISVDVERKHSWFSRKSWFTVHGDDYLARGHHPDGLEGKLQDYLKTQDIDHTQYSHVYLLTAAKFMNYSSNPVSIWLLYSKSNELKALLLEVNNTFDERHNYFVEPSPKSLNTSLNACHKSTRLTTTWPKDFYVSTFNDRSGCYSLSVIDPFAPNLTGAGYININITLSGPSNKNAMIVTLLQSAGSPLYPEKMSILEKIKFLSRWWWVGLATFPRTLQQAFILFFRKKMPWAFRPEPRRNTISRPADETERFIERHFRAFLKQRVENSQEAVAIQYQSAGLTGEHNTTYISNQTKSQKDSIEMCEIVALTPTFYSNLLRYRSLRNALDYESSKNQTISLSNYNIISNLLVEKSNPPSVPSVKAHGLNSFTRSLLVALGYFRKDPLHTPGHSASTLINPKVKYTRLSELDIYMLHYAKPAELKAYTWELARQVIIVNIAFDSLILWELEVVATRIISLWLILRRIFG
ncbi:putative cyclopropane-fatty-acyl-phospholipid synthase protein [Erysiphe neolycopersici]|uniref:Putative cyclopropane-fatty-acyl-phospholipid synthase protein n=1 Tax=Erysiphe neolycopersici TaxID=212602 RepID=A0A420HKB4_9PEZI|nr:putative cyclopropane-fatty-acyl-phospholipid synthase protein [Erysiphe neolycopersici]